MKDMINKQVIFDKYKNVFETIDFAIINDARGKSNFEIFKEILG